jgi:D-xylose transport system substrate-binding protein
MEACLIPIPNSAFLLGYHVSPCQVPALRRPGPNSPELALTRLEITRATVFSRRVSAFLRYFKPGQRVLRFFRAGSAGGGGGLAWDDSGVTSPHISVVCRWAVAVVAASVAATVLAACNRTDQPTQIAFLLASDQADRWTSADEPAFRKQIKRTCRGCDYVTMNAEGDFDAQAEQFEEALDDGADVIVLNPVDSERAEELIAAAGSVPVVAYDRFVPGADYYVSYDAKSTGTLQAEATVTALGGSGRILVVNGAQTDANGVAIKRARTKVFADSGLKVLAELDPLTWSAEEAGAWVAEQLKEHPIRTIDAIVAANDGQAGGIIAALIQAGVSPDRLPFVTGQDAELEALRRIVRGEQAMTVYKPIAAEARQAADIAVTLVTGGQVTGTTDYEGVPSFVFEPRAVAVGNLTNTVVRDGLHTAAAICDAATVTRCEELGIH